MHVGCTWNAMRPGKLKHHRQQPLVVVKAWPELSDGLVHHNKVLEVTPNVITHTTAAAGSDRGQQVK